MNQCPTVSVSFRQVDGLNFTSAYDMLTMVFADLYNKHLYLLEDSHVTEFQKKNVYKYCAWMWFGKRSEKQSCSFDDYDAAALW